MIIAAFFTTIGSPLANSSARLKGWERCLTHQARQRRKGVIPLNQSAFVFAFPAPAPAVIRATRRGIPYQVKSKFGTGWNSVFRKIAVLVSKLRKYVPALLIAEDFAHSSPARKNISASFFKHLRFPNAYLFQALTLSRLPGMRFTSRPSLNQAQCPPQKASSSPIGVCPMKPLSTALALLMGAGLGMHHAHAGPCSEQINQLETALRDSGGPPAGLTANQSIGAQLSHQPTPSSVERAREEAAAQADEVLMRAKELDATGKHAECMRAVKDARVRFGLD
jgi:hypothetical protein